MLRSQFTIQTLAINLHFQFHSFVTFGSNTKERAITDQNSPSGEQREAKKEKKDKEKRKDPHTRKKTREERRETEREPQ